ncbi:MAG TPA: efflux RND transporter periplasmic adaptor subunit, partial [Longimicrobiales bacterium]
GGGFSVFGLLPWLVAALLLAFVIYRVRATGQRPNWRALASGGTIGGLVLLAVMLAAAVYAVNHLRRAGAMTPIEAQAMEMNTPAPPGTAAVVLASVTRGPIQRTVRYTGQAVGYNEQDVNARTQGWLTWMPYYVGARVRAGQVIGRLDTSQINPQVAERQAAVAMAGQGVDVAQREYQQALAGVNQARAEVQGKRDAQAGAQSDIEAARQDLANAQADLAATQTQVTSAQAELSSAQADQQYWQQEIVRERSLLDKGAVSRDEYQREQSQAAQADAKVRQAQAGIDQVQAQVRAAQARIRKAEASVSSATRKAQQMGSDVRASEAAVRSAQAAADASRQRIAQAQAGVGQARGVLAAATTTRGYSEVRSLLDGVITQRLISPGTLVNPGQAVVRVAQTSPIRLQANVSQDDLDEVRIGSRVVVRSESEGGEPVVAHVTSITPAVDPVARTGVVEAVVRNADGRFLPGQFVVMDITTGSSRMALRVPSQAVHTRTNASTGLLAGEGAPYVWVAAPAAGQDGQYTVQQVDIQTGASDGTYTEVISGLQDGQQVV